MSGASEGSLGVPCVGLAAFGLSSRSLVARRDPPPRPQADISAVVGLFVDSAAHHAEATKSFRAHIGNVDCEQVAVSLHNLLEDLLESLGSSAALALQEISRSGSGPLS